MIFDRDSDWFFLRLNPIRVETPYGEDADIEYTFSDGGCSGTKAGIIFDFVELRSVVKQRHKLP